MALVKCGALLYLFIMTTSLFTHGLDSFYQLLLLPCFIGLMYAALLLSPPMLFYYFVRWIIRKEIRS